ncbi:hypothetical protein K438DRAFT_343175 [Mycena galopus ATCC 62051]|nr:hypothetical protein K438DRAFT_343175 [Mycena galopus ATCC 62051]
MARQPTSQFDSTTDTTQSTIMFSGASQFTVFAGAITNVGGNYTTASAATSDFRMISLGDMILLDKVVQDGGYGGTCRRQGQVSVRRMYSARIHGSDSIMTAAVYQGDGAEEQVREKISRYSELRHPNLLHLYGLVRSGGLHATVFHDDLIPTTELLQNYHNLHFSTVFVWACMEINLGMSTTTYLPFGEEIWTTGPCTRHGYVLQQVIFVSNSCLPSCISLNLI